MTPQNVDAAVQEIHTDLSQTMMAHCVSLVVEGVIQELPTLKFAFMEGGILWLPHLMWRFDKTWKAQRTETPWVLQPRSAGSGLEDGRSYR